MPSNFIYKNYFKKNKKKSHSLRALEMPQRLRALVALAEDPSSVPSMHMAAHSHLHRQFQGDPLPPPTSREQA